MEKPYNNNYSQRDISQCLSGEDLCFKFSSGYSDIDSVSSSSDIDYSKELRRKNSFSETSSEEGYYTSTSPELTNREEFIPELRSGRPKHLPPLTMKFEHKGKHSQGIDIIREPNERLTLEPLGLSPRMSINMKSVHPAARFGPPPGSPAYPKRPHFKGLSSLAGSLNNLACIPELEREVSDLVPISRQKATGIGGSCNDISCSIGSDCFKANPSVKSKPHHVPPMDLPNRIRSVFDDDLDQTLKKLDYAEKDGGDAKLYQKQVFRELSNSDLLKDSNKTRPFFREKSNNDLFKEDTNSLYREQSSERISNVHSRHLVREPSSDKLKDTFSSGCHNSKKSGDLLKNGWQLYREPSSHSLKKTELYREPSKDLLLSRSDHPYMREESGFSEIKRHSKKKDKLRKKQH